MTQKKGQVQMLGTIHLFFIPSLNYRGLETKKAERMSNLTFILYVFYFLSKSNS